MQGIFRKSAVGLAILGFAGAASAGMWHGVFFGVDGVDLQPRNGDLDFVSVVPNTTPGTIDTDAVHASYGWGWRIYGGFNFCHHNDFVASWLHQHTNNHSDSLSPVGSSLGSAATSNVRWLGQNTFNDIAAKINFDLDDVYGVFGHSLMIGNWGVRFGGGIEWAKLNSRMQDAGTISGSVYGYENHSNMHGVGPRVDFDFAYHLTHGFNAFARTSAALLIASRDINLETLDDKNAVELNNYDFSVRHVIVPRIGIKMGIGYTYAGAVGGEGSASTTSFTVEAGWQADTYIHAVERPEGFGDNNFVVSGNGTNYLNANSANVSTKVSNYGSQGFFLGARISTNWM